MSLELELMAVGLPAWTFSVPKLNWLAGLLHRQKCNDAFLTALAARDPKRLLELRDQADSELRTPQSALEWDPPSLERIIKNMARFKS